ncbi:MAG: M15 family metallopeptidase [Clostridia bacterium]|nr:M15 family metallopeptidase [Clostridia bacterium]
MARKKKRRQQPGQRILVAALAVALLAGAFGLGWHFGVESTRFRGNILLVNESHRLEADYVPDELVNLYQQRHSFRLASSEIMLTRQTYEAMERMFHAAEEADMNGYIVTSGYRSYQRQQEVYAQSEPGKAQQPGASEHQTGMAFDVTVETGDGFENTPQYSWLMAHAHEYGFIQRYPANKADITGISYEPWHYRYVGVDAATRMHQTGQVLEEFLGGNG